MTNETVLVLREQVARLTRERDEMRQERDVARQGGEKLLAGLRAEEQENERLQNLVADERATAEARIQSLLKERDEALVKLGQANALPRFTEDMDEDREGGLHYVGMVECQVGDWVKWSDLVSILNGTPDTNPRI